SSIFSHIRQSTFHSFNRLIDTAINKQVDFVLLVGDLFDSEQQSLKAQMQLKKGFERLQEQEIAVYLSYGNHDYLEGNKYSVQYPENVHVFPDEKIRSFIFEKEGKQLAEIYGFSYENRAVTMNKSLQYSLSNNSIPFHIA